MNIDKKRLIELVRKFPELHIAVVGDIALDVFHYGHIRLSGESAATTLTVDGCKDTAALGCAGNVAANIRSLGSQVALYGVLGPKDEPARSSVEQLCAEQYITLHPAEGVQTITKQRFLSTEHGTHLFRADFGEYADPLEYLQEADSLFEVARGLLLKKLSENMDNYSGVFFSDYDKGVFRNICESDLFVSCKMFGKTTVVDLKPKNAHLFGGATLVRVNLKEAQSITGRLSARGARIAHTLQAHVQTHYAAVSLGKDGLAISGDSCEEVIPTKARALFDVTGAGDTQGAAMLLTLCAGGTILDAAHIGNFSAGLTVEKPGTAVVSAEELIARIESDGT